MKTVKLNLTAVLGAGLLIFSSCSKERVNKNEDVEEIEDEVVEQVTENRITDYFSVEEFLVANMPQTQTFNFSSNDDPLMFTTAAGSEVTIYRSSLQKNNGEDVTGAIEVEFIEVLTLGDMILSQKPTTSNGDLLQSGGEFFINVTSEGEQVKMKPWQTYQVNLPTDNPLSPMIVFEGTDIASGLGFDWEAANQDSSQTFVEIGGEYYYMFCDEFQWINCDYWYGTSDPLTNVEVSPCDINMESFNAFLVFPDINAVMALYPDADNEVYVGLNIPEGQQGVVVAIGLGADGQLYLATQNFTATPGEVIQLDCLEITEEDLIAFLAGLG